MTNSIYGHYQIGNRLSTQDGEAEVDGVRGGDSRGLRTMAHSRLAAEGLRSRDGKASGQCFQTNQEHKTKNGFAPFAPLPLCGKRASSGQEQDAGNAVVDSVGCFYDGYSKLAAEGLRSRDGKASWQCFQTDQELATKKGFTPFASLPLCGKRASRWQEQDAGGAVVDFVGYLYDGQRLQDSSQNPSPVNPIL